MPWAYSRPVSYSGMSDLRSTNTSHGPAPAYIATQALVTSKQPTHTCCGLTLASSYLPHSRSLTISLNRKLILSQRKPVECQMPAPALSASQALVTSQEPIHPFAMSLLLRYSASGDLTSTYKGHTPSPALSAIQSRVTSQVHSTCPSHVSPSCLSATQAPVT